MTLDEKALIFLSQFEFITHTKVNNILKEFSCPSELFRADEKTLFSFKELLKDKFEIFLNALVNFNENDFFGNLNKRNIKCVTYISENYPKKLLRLKNPPIVLFYCGNLDLINTKTIAIVGTRVPTNYGKVITEKYSKELSKNGFTIISGLAMGIDKIAHEGAIEQNGNTIAVIGGGFDHMFPAMNVNLARTIAKGGLILTEYYPSIKPTKYSFPVRNRIIAALSDAVLITEANIGSGTLYTKEYADELGITTYVIPGNITSEKSNATNLLIKTGVAVCTTTPNDILKDFGIVIKEPIKSKKKETYQTMTEDDEKIYNLLKDGEKDFEYLLNKTGFSPQTLNYNLTTMEIRGIIKKLAGNTFVIC